MKTGTVALLVKTGTAETPQLVETVSDDQEILLLEKELEKGQADLVAALKGWRTTKHREEEEFGDYIEDLLSQPFVAPEVRKHGIQWMKSKIKIDRFKRTESEAAHVIADFAIKVYKENPACADFFLMGPNAKVRVKIFKLAA